MTDNTTRMTDKNLILEVFGTSTQGWFYESLTKQMVQRQRVFSERLLYRRTR